MNSRDDVVLEEVTDSSLRLQVSLPCVNNTSDVGIEAVVEPAGIRKQVNVMWSYDGKSWDIKNQLKLVYLESARTFHIAFPFEKDKIYLDIKVQQGGLKFNRLQFYCLK